MNLGGPELLIVLLVALLLFGGKKLPELARSMGTAKKEFEAGTRASATGATSVSAAVPVEQPPAPPAA